MRSEQLASSFDLKIARHFPAIAYLVYSGGSIGKMSLQSSTMIAQDGRVRFARSEAGPDGI
jgi:hypothetical protein